MREILCQAGKTLLGSLGHFVHGKLREGEPADVVALMGFKDARRAVLVSAEVGGGDPVLPLAGKDVVHHIEKLDDLDGKAILLVDLADEGVLKGLAELDTAAGEFPFFAFVPGFGAASGKEE